MDQCLERHPLTHGGIVFRRALPCRCPVNRRGGGDGPRQRTSQASHADLGRPEKTGSSPADRHGHRRRVTAGKRPDAVGSPRIEYSRIYSAHEYGQCDLYDLCFGAADRISRSGRIVRELQTSTHHYDDGAARDHGRTARPRGVRLIREYLQPDRRHHADRPRREERHIDRRVRESAQGPRRFVSVRPVRRMLRGG